MIENQLLLSSFFIANFLVACSNKSKNKSKDNGNISSTKEIEHAKNYLDIQKIRYDNKFTYEFIKKIETSSLYVPKLILQPIIENAIYHGIREKKSKSYIKIIVEKNPEYLIIKIIDNGLGPKEKKKIFQQNLEE